MNQPTPAIVAQAAVRRLPRLPLVLLCIAYVLAGFIGRDGWRSADMAGLGMMGEIARGTSLWWQPSILGSANEYPALLPYWLGAWAIQIAPHGVALDFAARIPFGLLLAFAMVSTWYGTYYLARSPRAQPVPFAFGGEALPADYARAMADGGLLAFIACLGLAQLAHETTPAMAQLAFSALLFYALAALPYRRWIPRIVALVALTGLSLSGAPTLAVLFGLGGAMIQAVDSKGIQSQTLDRSPTWSAKWDVAFLIVMSSAIFALAYKLGLLRWKIESPRFGWDYLNAHLQLLVWFTWPTWPLTAWTVWRWRQQLFRRDTSRHLALPIWFAAITVCTSLLTAEPDRSLLLALPAFASLAAFALPTLKRQVASLIDWFTLLFFSGCGITIWVVWIAMQSGFPPQPAANVTRLAPGFKPAFSLLAFAIAVLATLAWSWLVQWRAGRHRAAIWKSLVLPASGAALCWLLLMTLWMPLLNYAQGYTVLVHRITAITGNDGCIAVDGVGQGQIAALQWYGTLPVTSAKTDTHCTWLLVEPAGQSTLPDWVDTIRWAPHSLVQHPVDANESVWLLRRR